MDSLHGCTKNVARPFTSAEVITLLHVGLLIRGTVRQLCMCWCQYLHANIRPASWRALSSAEPTWLRIPMNVLVLLRELCARFEH